MRIHSFPLLSAASLLPSLASAITFDCSKIIQDGYKYNLKELGGVHEIFYAEKDGDLTSNTTYVMNICNTLGDAAIRGDLKCERSRNICGFWRKNYDDGERDDGFAFPIVGLEPMGHGAKDPEIKRLKKIDKGDREGLQVKLGGGWYLVGEKGKRKRKDASAVIEFECDPGRSGLEGLVEEASEQMLRVREEGEGEGDGGDEKDGEGDGEGGGDDEGKVPFDDGSRPERSLQYKSFDKEDDGSYVLRLNWKTRYACDNYALSHENSSGHWGFFTWLILIFFLCAAAYLIFGSWLNYNRYGARGWDLLPHGDTLRDVPYLFQDWVKRVINTLQGTGSRGGYSAV
ncbi:autophagy-related protein 27 [Aspergillus granulosus]|uniref:Autophagy-related protein 27 n=1 Tax=Aspergillus granulosus TaxID=176169 RepID=A0ABR4HSH4_9EURO